MSELLTIIIPSDPALPFIVVFVLFPEGGSALLLIRRLACGGFTEVSVSVREPWIS